MNAYYNKIDEQCKKKHMTHKELAEEIGITEVTMSRYLKCDRATRLCAFMAICRILDIVPEELYKTYLYTRVEMRVRKYREDHQKKEEGDE